MATECVILISSMDFNREKEIDMNMRILENEQIKVMVADSGAELSSVYDKENGVERLWDANPEVWNRHAPILFPFVGKVANGAYRIGEKEYPMKTQHGFARDMEFECVEETGTSVTHKLVATDVTKEIYPFDFELVVTHKLNAENPRVLEIEWEVKNTGEGLMYYSVGGHPAFTLPVKESAEREAYYLKFTGSDKLSYVGVNPENGLAAVDTVKELPMEDGYVKFFDDIYDTLIFDYKNIESVSIAKPDKTPYVTMTCEQFPFLGIWTKTTGNFICLEPWVGRTDNDGFKGTLEEKIGMEKLSAGESRKISHTVEFYK